MRYLVVADWDAEFHPTRINLVEGLEDAKANVDTLKNGLPENKKAPNAFYGAAPAAGFDIAFVVVDPSAQTFTYNSSGKATAEEAERWAEVRMERNRLLNVTDWWASSDLSITEEANTADPANPVWPVKPV